MKKEKWTFWNVVCLIGIPWYLMLVAIGIYLKWMYYRNEKGYIYEFTEVSSNRDILLYALIPLGWIIFKNITMIETPTTLFTWLRKPADKPPDVSVDKKKAQYPEVEECYLSNMPDQFALGVQNGKFVQFQLKEYLSILIFGSPGAGKSTLLLTMLIYHLHKKINVGEERPTFFVFDFKEGELFRKSCFPKQKGVRFISLKGRKDWGWNPYYRLNRNSTDDEVIRELSLIAEVLIDTKANEKNIFFTGSARTILIFIGVYDFRQGKSFIQTIDHIMKSDVKSLLEQVYEMSEGRIEFQKVRNAIAEYIGKDDNEAMQNIKINLKLKMEVFLYDDVRWALEYNPRKASCYDLERGISLFFYPGDTTVTDTVMKIIAKQLEYHCKHRDFLGLKGEELSQIIVVADECYTIGSLIDWAGWCSVARGFHTNIIMIWQSYSQIVETFNEHMAESLIDDVAATAILAVNSAKNAKQFVKFAGDYIEEKRSYSHGGSNDGNYTISYESKPILTEKDILQLRKNKEAILLMDGAYYRINSEGARYYKIPVLRDKSKKCLEAHRHRE